MSREYLVGFVVEEILRRGLWLGWTCVNRGMLIWETETEKNGSPGSIVEIVYHRKDGLAFSPGIKINYKVVIVKVVTSHVTLQIISVNLTKTPQLYGDGQGLHWGKESKFIKINFLECKTLLKSKYLITF